ncbi:MAG TPA: DUF1499 domain-containing protein [Herpetosiphonaceae bacterium]
MIDLLPWEQIFLGSSLGLLITSIISGITLLRRRALGPIRWFLLTIFAVGAILPWLAQPRFGARLRRSSQTNIAATGDDAEWPELKPRRYDRSTAEVMQAAVRALDHLSWKLASQESLALAAEVPIANTPFVDDFRVTLSEEASQTVVNVHSSSRVGKGDMGANRRHVIQFFIVLEQQLQSSAQP